MNDDRTRLLHAWIDGALSSEERSEVERILAHDPEMRRELRELERLRDATSELPSEIPPARDLWPGIEQRISKGKIVRGRFTAWQRGLLAAAAALLLMIGSYSIGTRSGNPPAETASVVLPQDLPADAGTLDALEAEYATASEDLFERLRGRDELDPDTVELIHRNLDLIDDAVKEIRDALEEDPENLALSRRLTAEYGRRGAVMRRAARLADTI